ncbi:hypothetical protein, partial [Providencia manganoxydans]|uniref:hypothetical protein n=1 Tax=Providencia manganoxydans TaxID=2923283 RepID=UPI0034E5E4BA
ARCRILRFSIRKSSNYFQLFLSFFTSTVIGVIFQTSPPERLAVSVDAHYRESENSGNPFFAFSFR